jgi:hypothetical protein
LKEFSTMAEKSWGNTVLGWFIVQEGEENAPAAAAPDTTADELNAKYANAGGATDDEATVVRAAATPAPPPPPVPETYGAPPPAPGGQVDFVAVFEAGGVDKDERERVEKAQSLLNSLPEGTDTAVKKQIVEASLNAFGVPIEKIIEAGVGEIQALEYYLRSGAQDTEKLLQESAQRIQQYEEEIKTIRRVMEERVAEQNAVVAACNGKKLEVQKILEFFGREAVAEVVKASPKLQEPGQVGSGE